MLCLNYNSLDLKEPSQLIAGESQLTKTRNSETEPTFGPVVFPSVIVLCASLAFFLAGLIYRLLVPESPEFKVQDVPFSLTVSIIATLTTAIVISVSSVMLWKNQAAVCALLLKHEEEIERLLERHLPLWIILCSALGLFAELILIRIQSSYLQIFAVFKNISLLACFLGLGVGYAQGARWRLLTPFVMPVFAIQLLFVGLLRLAQINNVLRSPASDEVLWGLVTPQHFLDVAIVYSLIIFIFVITALTVLPLGQIASRAMEKQNKLSAYNWNLIGGLLGVTSFVMVCAFWTPPAVWIAILFIGLLPFLIGPRIILVSNTCACLLMMTFLALPLVPLKLDIYSPYQTVTLGLNKDHNGIFQNNIPFQENVDLSEAGLQYKPSYKDWWATTYNLPFLFKANPEDVLIIGAGTGNDTAAAIRNGAHQVDAVEIDPSIIWLGKELHPEQPFASPNVRTFAQDARSFVRHSHKKYDVVIYGLVASSSTLSALSGGIRLDNYLYTSDSIREARALLKPSGLLIVSMRVSNPFDKKIFCIIQSAFDGMTPLVYEKQTGAYSHSDHIYIAAEKTPSALVIENYKEVSEGLRKDATPVDVATDDWPYLLMYKRLFPFSLFAVFIVLLSVSFLVIRVSIPSVLRNFSWPCFFLGTGFMLIETKAITELTLVYGASWLVTAIVIGSILTLALIANLFVMGRGVPSRAVTYPLLIGSILCGYFATQHGYSITASAIDTPLITAVLTAPLLFSGLVFSGELKAANSISTALCSNLFGAMLGGLLEYSSMYFGYRALYIVAIAIYVAALFFASVRRKSSLPQQAV
jgi:SAM-dependent methyltransferase